MAQPSSGQPRGFSGFDSLVSDITDLPQESAHDVPPRVVDKAPEPKDELRPPPPRPAPSPTSTGGRSGPLWEIVIVGVAIALALYLGSGGTLLPSVEQTTSDRRVASTTPIAPQSPAPAPPAKPSLPPEQAEVVPPIGADNILTVEQVRYCLVQEIRLDGARLSLNRSSKIEIEVFNYLVSNFNSRCARYRYQAGVLERERMRAEGRRSQLELDGISMLGAEVAQRSPALAVPPPPPTPPAPASVGRPVFAPIPDRKPVPPQRSALPEHTGPDITGQRPEACKRGFKQVGSDCVPVRLPENAQLDYTGRDWACQRGFRRSGKECLAIVVPPNAQLDYTGSDWMCQRGFRRDGDECQVVKVPTNAEIDYTGSDWTCRRGFRRSENQCLTVNVPTNAQLDFKGNDWICLAGFNRVGQECIWGNR